MKPVCFSPDPVEAKEGIMFWELCIQYANGTEQVLKVFRDLEAALNCVDRIYAEGYPMHVAYMVRPACNA
ncbi:MAG TPA: hypothetical protein V6D29_08390 [Leptolyngbyaceae cyanobacterium]